MLNASRVGRPGGAGAPVLAVLLILGSQYVCAQQAPNAFEYQRSSSFEYRSDGLLEKETIEKSNALLCVSTSYTYDAYGNKTGSTTANCPGATNLAVFNTRRSTVEFSSHSVIIAGTTIVTPAGAFASATKSALTDNIQDAETLTEQRVIDPRFGQVLKTTAPNGVVTQWVHDAFGRPTVEIYPNQTKLLKYYCLLSRTYNGNPIDTSSNSIGCPDGSADALNDAIRFEHSVLVKSDNAPIGPFTRTYFDRAGRALRTVVEAFDGPSQPQGSQRLVYQDTEYTNTGSVDVSTQPYFKDSGSSLATGNLEYGVTRTKYDVLGRPTYVYTADANANSSGQGGLESCGAEQVRFGSRGCRKAAVSAFSYDRNSTTITDDKARTKVEERNLDGKVVRTTDSSGATPLGGAQVVFQHDAFGNIIYTRDPLLNIVSVDYDIRGRKIRMTDPDAGVVVYCYDALGQLRAQQTSAMRGNHTPGACPTSTPSALWTTLSYDRIGRLTQRAEPEYTSTWTYDRYADGSACTAGKGKLCQSSTTHGVSKKFFFDALGRPVSSRTDLSDGVSAATAVTYDAATGRPDKRLYPTGLAVAFKYTQRGYMHRMELATGVTVNPLPAQPGGTPAASLSLAQGTALWEAKALNAWGKAELQTYSNGVNSRAEVDPQIGRLTRLTAGKNQASDVTDQRYTWDSVGLLTKRVDALGDGSNVEVQDVFVYDKLGRLTEYTVSGNGTPVSRTVSLVYNALGMLLYKSDVGAYTYGAQGVAGGKPHSLVSINGVSPSSFSYDLNGNLVSSTDSRFRNISYTSFNLPDGQYGVSGPSGSPRYTWQYDENHQRYKEIRLNSSGVRTTWMFHPDNQGGLGFEREIAPDGAHSNRHYLSAGGATFGLIVSSGALPTLQANTTSPTQLSALTANKLEFWHKDQLGSLIATTDHQGTTTARMAYDPFGKRRFTNSTYDAFGGLLVDWTTNTNAGTDRGFTGHEHLDDVGLIHMNGRIYEPTLGRFLQPDPIVQSPTNLQNYDRYSYCFNSPLICTDPSGYTALNPFKQLKYLDPIGHYVLYRSSRTELGYTIGSIGIGVLSIWCTGWAPLCNGAGQAAWAGFSGKSDSEAFRVGVIAGFTTMAFQAIGASTMPDGLKNATLFQKVTNVAGHAMAGCVFAELQDGDCGSGALSGTFGSVYKNFVGYSTGSLPGQVTESALVGGIGSVLGGGKFANGAVTGAFGYLFNNCGPGYGNHCLKSFRQYLSESPLGSLWDSMFGPPREPAPTQTSITIGGTVMAGPVGVSQEYGGVRSASSPQACLIYSKCVLFGAGLGATADMNFAVSTGDPSNGWQASLFGKAALPLLGGEGSISYGSDGPGLGIGWARGFFVGGGLKICQQVCDKQLAIGKE